MPMLLSVVIVNYKVPDFLIQTLYAVEAAQKQAEQAFGANSVEIFVVDNLSQDHSGEWVNELFPRVIFIQNKDNEGFAKGNNIALKKAKGKYKLLLNPDTLIPENTFIKTVNYLEEHAEIGALGVRMTDISGQFAPESKRSVPNAGSAFFKLAGLSKLFPKSKFFGKYQLSYLPEFQISEIEVVSGAFNMIRSEALEKAGLLDEVFFMYGEDIDLSYRTLKAGYKNVYFPEITIIHYKGESSKQNTERYIRVFYEAMIIFAQKHYSRFAYLTYRLLISVLIRFKLLLNRKKSTKAEVEITKYAQGVFVSSNESDYANFAKTFPEKSHYSFVSETNFLDSEFLNMEIVFAFPEISAKRIIEFSAKSISQNINVRTFLTQKKRIV